MAYLDEHPPRRSQFRCPRRAGLSGVIVAHTAENAPDTIPVDGGAEAVAKFIVGRSDPGSYHDLVDSDSAINLVRYDCEAYHDGTGSNPHSLGLSWATTAAKWPSMPQWWVAGAITNGVLAAARMADHVKARTGIVVPARRITRGESELRMPGFISHAERDPARRHDPGAFFPWDLFLDGFARVTQGPPGPLPLPPEAPDMSFTLVYDEDRYNAGQGGEWYWTDGVRRLLCGSGVEPQVAEQMVWNYAKAGFKVQFLPPPAGSKTPQPYPWPGWMVQNLIPWRPGIDDALIPFP